MQTPVGEEVLEGVLGGAMVGGPMFLDSDKSTGQAALTTASTIAGGIALGMAGRRLGAAVGKRLHPGAVKNNVMQMIGRTAGQETIGEAIDKNVAYFKGVVKEKLLDHERKTVLSDFAQMNKEDFARVHPGIARLNLSGEDLRRAAEQGASPEGIKKLNSVLEAADAFGKNATDAQVTAVKKDLLGLASEGVSAFEKEMANDVALDLEGRLQRLINEDPDWKKHAERLGVDIGPIINAKDADVTGEHVGRAFGRVFGDEAGILAGYALAGAAADQLGVKSAKDARIEELEAQLLSQAAARY